jgi:DNA-binding SARP family transcriptional activator
MRIALEAAAASEAAPAMKWWLRRYTEHLSALFPFSKAEITIPRLIELDASTWTGPVVQQIDSLDRRERAATLEAIALHADSSALEILSSGASAEIREVHRQLAQRFADRIMVRAFGKLRVQRRSWEGTPLELERKRLRLLLGLLVASGGKSLSRDELIEQLWPDSELAAAINSLNQAVFQLRRLFDPSYREGVSPQYLISSTDAVFLNPELVITDLDALRDIATRLRSPMDTTSRAELAALMTAYVQGGFLAELKYEDWAGRAQLAIHGEVRAALLPIAQGEGMHPTDPTILAAGSALTLLDPYDETAHVAIARHLAESGRRRQARSHIQGFIERLRVEFDEEPSEAVQLAAALVGAKHGSMSI